MTQFDIKGPEPSKKEVEEKKRAVEEHVKPTFGSGEAFKLDANYRKLASFLELKPEDRDDVEVAQKVAFIRDYTGEKEELDAMVKIRDMIHKLGLPTQGKELVKSLYAYARLSKERERIDKEISLITKV